MTRAWLVPALVPLCFLSKTIQHNVICVITPADSHERLACAELQRRHIQAGIELDAGVLTPKRRRRRGGL